MERNIEYAWLQISDCHLFEDEVSEWNFLRGKIKSIPNIDAVSFVTATGDLHQYGHSYDNTGKFLEELLNELELDKENLFIVPGNHDSGNLPGDDSKKRSKKRAYTKIIASETEKNPDAYQEYFADDMLGGCFREYSNFICQFYGDKNPYKNPEKICVRSWKSKTHSECGVNIVHLNSAINCNNEIDEKNVIDICELSRLSEKDFSNGFPTIILAHHPFDTLFQSHQNALKRVIINCNIKAYLCGDKHKQLISRIELNKNMTSSIPCIVCGKIYPEKGDDYSDIGVILYIKYKDSKKVEIMPYSWNKKYKRFDPCIDFHTDEGNANFEFIDDAVSRDKSKKEYITAINTPNEISIGESIWLPDAEKACGKQAKFDYFTSTDVITRFLADKPGFWGITAVKGIGKTFVQQIKRVRINKSKRICLPLGVVPSVNNAWGTETIRLDDITRKTSLKNLDNITKLWKYCIIVYAINQLYNIKNKVEMNSSWDTSNPAEELKKVLEKEYQSGKLTAETLEICTDERYMNLNDIMHQVLRNKAWTRDVSSDLGSLILYKFEIKKTLQHIGKESLTIFIDKVDQAITQTKAEKPAGCENCQKIATIQNCLGSVENGTQRTIRKDREIDMEWITEGSDNPCMACPIIKGEEYRIYSNGDKSYSHVNVWQYFQIGLLSAVSFIKENFNSIIEIYFTIREEAFACDDNIFGENKRKITSICESLSYTKEEQKRIFYETIRKQQPGYLYSPALREKEGREEEAFVGVSELCHPYVKNIKETVFESIYRHSFDRSRDIQEYGQMLTKKMPEIRKIDDVIKRGEKVKTYIEIKAAELAFTAYENKDPQKMCYYDEKINFLPDFWTKRDNFKKLLFMFKKNLMFGDEAKKICCEFNECGTCAERCSTCTAKHHPFSMLYKLGMLGQIRMNSGYADIQQEFISSKDVTYIVGKDIISLNEDTLYVLHPALTKSIETLGNSILHFGGFIIGRDLLISRDKIELLSKIYSNSTLENYENRFFFKKRGLVSDGTLLSGGQTAF